MIYSIIHMGREINMEAKKRKGKKEWMIFYNLLQKLCSMFKNIRTYYTLDIKKKEKKKKQMST